MPVLRQYTNHVFLEDEKVTDISDKILDLIKNELPEEARLYCVYRSILKEAESKLSDAIVLII